MMIIKIKPKKVKGQLYKNNFQSKISKLHNDSKTLGLKKIRKEKKNNENGKKNLYMQKNK